MSIIKTGKNWQFINESTLEDFVWAHLTELLKLKPLKRQYCVEQQYCDILAIGQQRNLVIIELKNVEDRYVIPQLTRYYDAIVKNKPFSDIVDYEQEIALIAIAPNFHRDNLIDVAYNKLNFNLFNFEIAEYRNKPLFKLNHYQTLEEIFKKPITLPKEKDMAPIAEPPKALRNRLSYLAGSLPDRILAIREKILNYDSRIIEIVEQNAFLYGKSKTKLCAELRFPTNKNPIIFLWLPFVGKGDKKVRMKVCTEDWETITSVIHMSSGTVRATSRAYLFNSYQLSIKYSNDPNYPKLTRMKNSLDS